MKYLAILGRQPEISLAELKAQFGVGAVKRLSETVAEFDASSEPDLKRFGGSLKFATELENSPLEYLSALPEGKITLGVSDYSAKPSKKRASAEALRLKQILKRHGRSVRVLPLSNAPVISTAAAHHNSLGEKPLRVELILAPDKRWFRSIGTQNITAYARRDQARPFRDARVGMLPPKLAQILINLCGPLPQGARILDPFCGTGVVLQEAVLMGYSAYGTDADDRMVDYAKKNLTWLTESENFASRRPDGARQRESERGSPVATGRVDASAGSEFSLSVGDAKDYTWQQPIDAVAFEGYLGPPMSTPPADIKMKSVMVDLYSLYYHTLRNLSSQIASGTPVVMAVPAWLRPNGEYSRLNLLDEIDKLSYNVEKSLGSDLLYARAGQVVAREIIILRKK